MIHHTRHHHHTTPLYTATFYRRQDSNPHLADGTWYNEHGGFCAAIKSIPLHARVRLYDPTTHRSVVLVVRDRGGVLNPHTPFDLPCRSFARLAGRHWYRVGRIPIRYHILSVPKKRKHKHHHHHLGS